MSFLRGIAKKSKSSRRSPDRTDGPVASPLTKYTTSAEHIQDTHENMDDVLKNLSLASATYDAPGSPIITIENPTPDPSRYINKPPPLDLSVSKRDSLGETHLPSSHSLDSIASTPSRSSLDSVHSISPLMRPSSPLLSAVREAVDSLSNMEDFEQLGLIGSGFFAEVHKVRHIPTNQVMVLKFNKRQTPTKTLREVELLKRLYHPNILHYIGACVHNGQLHPLTEFVNGGTVEDYIQNLRLPFTPQMKIEWGLDIAKGMEYLHSHDMLHRDLNSHNCFLRKNGDRYTAVVADFGLAAKTPSNLRKLTRNQSIVGTPFWMAPEVLMGKPYNKKADVFSYGIVLCEMISRKSADPDEIPRSNNFSLDEKGFRALPEVLESNCPEPFLNLACACSQVNQLDRPEFTAVILKLLEVAESPSTRGKRADSLPPVPNHRLSWNGIADTHTPSVNNSPVD